MSLPGTTSLASSVSSTSQRKTLSPSHASARRSLSSSLSSSSSTAARDGTLLALPLAKQLHELKSRNAHLSKTLAAQQATAAKAAERIKALEDEREKERTEAEGWEAEAQRLGAELASGAPSSAGPSAAPAAAQGAAAEERADLVARVQQLERELATESSKRRRAKEMQSKLRCELVNRRWKEKWEVELLEREERRWEIRVVELEAEVAEERYRKEMEKAEKAELQVRLALG